MKAYTLRKDISSGELHLFEGDMTEGGCTSDAKSICSKLAKSDALKNVFACKNEANARIICADIGRKVCGLCVSHLYDTYP